MDIYSPKSRIVYIYLCIAIILFQHAFDLMGYRNSRWMIVVEVVSCYISVIYLLQFRFFLGKQFHLPQMNFAFLAVIFSYCFLTLMGMLSLALPPDFAYGEGIVNWLVSIFLWAGYIFISIFYSINYCYIGNKMVQGLRLNKKMYVTGYFYLLSPLIVVLNIAAWLLAIESWYHIMIFTEVVPLLLILLTTKEIQKQSSLTTPIV